MSRMRTHIAFLLLIALSMSSLASVNTPCAQRSDGPGEAQIAAIDASLRHHEAAPEESERTAVSTQHSAHRGGPGSEIEPGNDECPCCDDCERLCVLASCNPAIQPILPVAPLLAGGKCCLSSAAEFRVGPPKHVLYRPPINSI